MRKSTVRRLIREHEHRRRDIEIRGMIREEIRRALGPYVRIERSEPISGSTWPLLEFPHLDISRIESDVEFLLSQADAFDAPDEDEEVPADE